MKYFIWMLVGAMGFVACNEKTETTTKTETPESPNVVVDKTYRPLLHFFTSTGCGGCGRFGIPVFDDVATSMGDTILALPTHFKYEDKYITQSSLAIEKAVVKHYSSPQIWVNMKEITYDIIPFPISVAKEKTKVALRNELNISPEAYLGLKANLKENGRFNVDFAVQRSAESTGDLYYEIYAMEDGLVGSQAGADPFVATHARVNRGGFYGGMGQKLLTEAGETIQKNIEFVPCSDCTSANMYFYAIVWKEVAPGKFEYVNGVKYNP